jgi:hypothetical protein
LIFLATMARADQIADYAASFGPLEDQVETQETAIPGVGEPRREQEPPSIFVGPDVLLPPPKPNIILRTFKPLRQDIRHGQNPAIWASFYANFQACAPGCVPVQYAVYGERGNLSCHPSGQAIDVGGISCNGVKYSALGRGRFEEFVACMVNPRRKGHMRHKIYRDFQNLRRTGNRTAAHFDHAHFSNDCYPGGHHVW